MADPLNILPTAPNTNTIPLDTGQGTPDTPDTISLDTGTPSANYTLDPNTGKIRSFKAAYGLQGTTAARPAEDINNQVSFGQEQDARDQATANLNDGVNQRRSDIVLQGLAAKKGPLTDDDFKAINGASSMFAPNSVFEINFGDAYSKEISNFAQQLDGTNAWNAMQQAERAFPESDTDAIKKFGSVVTAKVDKIRNTLENRLSEINKQDWPSYLTDYAKSAFPFFNPYHELQQRGNVPDVSRLQGGLLGENLIAQRQRLLELPLAGNQFADTVQKIDQSFSNPQEAASFWNSMLGQDHLDRLLNNINTVGNLTDAAAILKIGSLPFRAASLRFQANQAMRTAVEGLAVDPDVTKAKILASVGDIPGSVAEDFTKFVSPSTSITEQGLNDLFRYFRLDMANIDKDPGSVTIALRNAMKEQYTARMSQIQQTLTDTLRPQFPVEDMTPTEVKALQAETIGRYSNLPNRVINASDPFYEPLSNKYFITYRIGDNGGTAFSSEEHALQTARQEGIGITYTPEQMANLDARIADMEDRVKSVRMDEDTAGLNAHFSNEQQLADLKAQKVAALEAQGKGYSTIKSDQPKEFPQDSRIADLKAQLKESPSMEDDVHGLNARYAAEEELKNLEATKSGVTQQGLGYYIEVTKPVNETGSVFRDFIYNPETPRKGAQLPKSFANDVPFVALIRTSEDTMSPEGSMLRKAATYPQERLQALAYEEYKNIRKVYGIFRKDEWRAFNRSLEYAQTAKDSLGREGYFFETPGQLEDWYQRTFDRLPSTREHLAYQATKRWAELDLALRELSLRRNKLHLGAETHELSVKRPDGTIVKSPRFDGMSLSKLPGGRGAILMVDNAGSRLVQFEEEASQAFSQESKAKAKTLPSIPTKTKKEINDLIGQYKLIQLYDPEARPLTNFVEGGSNRIQYVLAKDVETFPLDWQQLPFRGGGHFVYDYTHYVKQPIMRHETVGGGNQHWYEGDRTVAPVAYTSIGEDFAKKMNHVRTLIRDGMDTEAEAFTAKHLPFDYKTLKVKFRGGKDAAGNPIPPTFNLDENFRVVPRNKSIIEMDKNFADKYGKNFRDGTREGSPARNFQVAFTGKRDSDELKELTTTGTTTDPVFGWRPAKKVDPLETMNRSLGSIIRSTFMDDYKTQAVEQWLRQAGPYLKATESEIKSSPFFHFATADKNSFIAGQRNEGIVKQLMANRFKINEFVGVPSQWDTYLHGVASKLANTAYDKFGPAVANKITPPWLLHTLRDPAAFLRSLTFTAYLGAFAPWQIWVQLMSYVNMFAYSPKYAMSGTMAAFLHGASKLNGHPEIMDALDKIAVGMSSTPGMAKYRPGELAESIATLNRTGFTHVNAEYGPISSLNYAKPVMSGLDKFLYLSRKPFQWGEQGVRVGAWHMAFKEFRDANPAGKISNTDLQNIINRADFLYGNMSSASASVLHSGLASLATQFYQYTLRLSEQFFSASRLGGTIGERAMIRARLVAANAAMFGIPLAGGLAGFPLADYLRQEMLGGSQEDAWFNPAKYIRPLVGSGKPYNSADINSGAWSDFARHVLMEGVPQTLMYLASGNNYNFGPRMGSQGFTAIKDSLSGDTGFWGTIFGASGSLSMNSWHNQPNFISTMSSIANKDPNAWKLALGDLYDATKSISSVGKAGQLFMALNTGKWFSTNGQYLKDVSKLDAAFMFFSGLSPSEQADMHNISVNLKDKENVWKEAEKQFENVMSRGFAAAANQDQDLAGSFFKKAVATLVAADVPVARINDSMKSVIKLNQSLIDRTSFENYGNPKNLPAGQEKQYQDVYGVIRRNLYKGQ